MKKSALDPSLPDFHCLVLLNVNSYIQQIIIGVIIVLAVAFDTFAKSRRRRA